MNFAIERDGTQLKKETLVHSRFSFLFKNNNIDWYFVGKLEQVSTYILWKFKTINVRKLNMVQVRPLTAKSKN